MSLTFPCRAACLLLGICVPLAATAQLPGASGPKQATAVRVERNTVRVDGRLDEPAWQQATPIRDLVQKEPVEGAEPGDPTEVRLLYDDDALYVGARMHSGGGRSTMQAPMSRRDEVDQADYIRISLDTYLDRRTAYSFGVTASGVRLDHYHPSDSETSIDEGFDPVWEARVFIDEEGWTAEMWIPLSQLRFNDLPEQVWGLNIHRWVPSRNEDDYWVAVPRTAQGWASHFGELRGIGGIEPPRRIELLPYVAAGSTVTGSRDPSNPFDDGRNLEGRVGADLKMGLGPNLTLEATVNPDFGQIEADPAVVNLTAFETFFSERRPFFSEGSQMIGGNVVNYFYSRRIGAPPAGPASGDFIDYPRSTTILGAAKLTGRSSSGTSIGILGAVTDEEHARTFDVGSEALRRIRVAPRTAWGAGRVQREFGAAGSTASLMFAGVHRNLATGDPLAALMVRNAFTATGESLIRLLGGEYEILVNAGLSRVEGDAPAILRVQRANQRYFQRPDAPHVELDPTRTGMTGVKAQVQVEKTSGRHWLWDVFFDLESPDVEFNDIGRLTSGDGLVASQGLTFRETEPGGTFRAYRLSVGNRTEWNFARDRQYTRLTGNANLTWNNFWTTSASTTVSLRAQDQRLTRGGPSMGTALGWSSSLDLRSPTSAQTRWDAALDYARDELGGWTARVEAGISLQPASQWQLSLNPAYERDINPRQYVSTRPGGRPVTYGSRYIFAWTDRTTISTQVRLNVTLKPDLNLDIYAEPFAASGRYYDFGELRAARSRLLRRYGTDGTTAERLADGALHVRDGSDAFVIPNQDFNVRSFRSTTVLRWEWRPGSTLYLVWQQDRSADEVGGSRTGLGDVFGSITSPGDNFFAVKASFWLPR